VEALARLGLFVTCLLAIYVGARTLLIWRRTRKVAELSIGSNVLGIAVGGALLVGLGAFYPEPGTSPFLPFALGLLGLAVHVTAQFVGTWKIFRAGEGWAPALVAVAALLTVVWLVGSLIDRDPAMWRVFLYNGLRGVGTSWGVYECFRYAGALRKRAALGLADAMTAHRIWLWGVGGSAQLVVIGLELGSQMTTGTALGATPLGLHITSALGLAGAGTVALAFFPPAAYVAFVTRRASAPERAERVETEPQA
jgi:hypothetical protein